MTLDPNAASKEIVNDIKQFRPELYERWLGLADRLPELASVLLTALGQLIGAAEEAGANPDEITSFLEFALEVSKRTKEVVEGQGESADGADDRDRGDE